MEALFDWRVSKTALESYNAPRFGVFRQRKLLVIRVGDQTRAFSESLVMISLHGRVIRMDWLIYEAVDPLPPDFHCTQIFHLHHRHAVTE